MGEADVALSINWTAGEYKDTLEIILNEAEKLDKKIKALLMTLPRLDLMVKFRSSIR